MRTDTELEVVEPLSWSGVEEVRRHPASRAELALVAKIDQLHDALVLVREWTRRYGSDLCPGTHADTFGAGMREAKEAVARLLGDR